MALLIVQVSLAQENSIVLEPGLDSEVGLKLIPHEAIWKVTSVDSTGSVHTKVFWRDRYEIDVSGDSPRWKFTQLFTSPEGRSVGSSKFYTRYESVEPISAQQAYPPNSLTISYTRDKVSGTIHKEGESPKGFEAELNQPVFEAAFIIPFLLSTELSTGLRVKVPVYGGTYNGVNGSTWMILSVVANIEMDGQKIWIIKNEMNWQYRFIDKPPYVLELRVPKEYGLDTYELLNYNLLKDN